MISLYHAAIEGQARVNNDWEGGCNTFRGCSNKNRANVNSSGTFHSLPWEIHESLIMVRKENLTRTKKSCGD